jgi:hypothetical protein
MKNVTTFDNFPTFAENGSRNMNTESAKYQIGFVEADTFPAEWCNYLFHGATKGVSDLNTAVQSIWQENINVITQSGQTPNPNSTNQLYTAIQTFINNAVLTANAQVLAQAKLDAHPIGSLYWSSDPTDPSTLFGGTWVRIKDRFVLAAGDTYANGATGGSATVKLTESQLPTHKHSFSGTTGNESRGHTHSGSTDTMTSGYTTGGMSGNAKGEMRINYTGSFGNIEVSQQVTPFTGNMASSTTVHDNFARESGTSDSCLGVLKIDVSHTHDFKHTHSFTTGEISQNHTHDFSGNTDNKGDGNAFSILPPYITKYCWERIA